MRLRAGQGVRRVVLGAEWKTLFGNERERGMLAPRRNPTASCEVDFDFDDANTNIRPCLFQRNMTEPQKPHHPPKQTATCTNTDYKHHTQEPPHQNTTGSLNNPPLSQLVLSTSRRYLLPPGHVERVQAVVVVDSRPPLPPRPSHDIVNTRPPRQRPQRTVYDARGVPIASAGAVGEGQRAQLAEPSALAHVLRKRREVLLLMISKGAKRR